MIPYRVYFFYIESNVKIYVKKGSAIYNKLSKIAHKKGLSNAESLVSKHGNARLFLSDDYIFPIGKIVVKKKENGEKIYMELTPDEIGQMKHLVFYDTFNLQYYGDGMKPAIGIPKYEYILEGITGVNQLRKLAEKIEKKSNVSDNCQISCRTAQWKQASIRVQFSDNNYATFYSDGWSNSKNKCFIHRHGNNPIKNNDHFITYAIVQGKDEMIANKNGDGICVYPDGYVNPVKNNKTKPEIGKKVDTNLFEFIENTFFDYNKNKSKLKKPNQNNTEYSLNETN